MGEVAASVAVVEAGGSAPVPAEASRGISFVDGDPGADPAGAILDEVLSGDGEAAKSAEQAENGDGLPGEVTRVETPPAKAPEPKPETPPEGIEGARLRKGFAKLAEERQRLVDQQNALRTERQAVQQFAAKAEAHDKLVARLREDPASVIAELGDELVNKTLQGFIDREKSPAEREVARLRGDVERQRAADVQREQERVASEWRAGIARQVQADERFDLVNTLGLHGDVVDVITGYYEKHSERDDKGNVTVPALLPWDVAAQAVEEREAAKFERSKRYGKRAPTAETPAAAGTKDTPPAKNPPAAAKKATTSLSSVPVAEGPSKDEDFPTDDLDERQRRVLASLGL